MNDAASLSAGIESLRDAKLCQHEGVAPIELMNAVIAPPGPAVAAMQVDEE